MRGFQLLKEEIVSIFSNKKMLIPVIAVMFVPVLYAGLFLWAFWNPYEKLDKLPVAVVNKDIGAEMEDKRLEIGKDLEDELKKNTDFGWSFVSEKEAKDGLEHREYYMMVVIPENFSENASTVLDDHPKQLEIKYIPNASSNFLSAQIGGTAMEKVKEKVANEVSKSYAEVLFDNFDTISDGFQKAADGAGELNDGSNQLNDGANQLNDGIQTAEKGANDLHDGAVKAEKGANDLSNGIGTAANGTNELKKNIYLLAENQTKLADGVNTAKAGSSKLQDGAGQLKEGTNTLTNELTNKKSSILALNEGAQAASEGAQKLNTGLNQLNQDIPSLVAGSQKLNDGINGEKGLKVGAQQLASGTASLGVGAQELDNGLNALSQGVQDFSDKANGILTSPDLTDEQKVVAMQQLMNNDKMKKLVPNVNALSEGAQRLNSGINGEKGLKIGAQQLVSGAEMLGAGSEQLATSLETKVSPAVNQLAQGSNQLVDEQKGLPALAAGTNTLVAGWDGAIAGASKLDAGVGQLQGGINELAGGMSQLQSGSSQLADGSWKLAAGSDQLANGMGQLQDGSTKLASGLGSLNEGTLKLSDGMLQLADGSGKLAEGTEKLTDGSDELATKLQDAADEIGDVNANDETYTMFADPVSLKEEVLNEVPNYGTGFAPYFISLGIYVGSLILSIVLVFKQPAAKPRSAFSWYFSKFLLINSIAIMEALIVDVLMLFGLGLEVQSVGYFVLFSIVTAVTFATLIQFLVTLLGDPGRFIAIILLILQLISSAGTFPLELVPNFVQGFNAWLPMTYTVFGFKAAISSGDYAFMWQNIGVLFIFIGIHIVLTLLYFMRQYRLNYSGFAQEEAAEA
ncbi:YhgE/Pip domain-containing protein [Massilibacterium senegalense]|uniref:YhgE/Pip domain-containing protein n=1 Tax=Massilibacterium senegalense TaxID=1632858 RepID=UPI0007826FE3|nr:YhgE/Pip domain-containing protein [Massilibacterium senegalense]